MPTDALASARRTLLLEAACVQALVHQLTPHFAQAVQLIHERPGRVVMSGVGKSALIAQKITATLNSTGTPALFMHAADAIHGDLGMVQPGDTVVLISKSGNSPEIKVLLPLLENLGAPIIAITGNVQGELALAARLVLNTTVSQEACPNNLAPTSSTTAQLAMGDALAVALMEQKQFSNQDFARYHPGGALGRQLYLRVTDLMGRQPAPQVQLNDPLRQVIMAIGKGMVGCTAVLQGHTLAGIITDGDVRRLLERTEDLSGLTAAHLMNAQPKTIAGDALASDAFLRLKANDISQLLVMKPNGEYAGVIHLLQLIREGFL